MRFKIVLCVLMGGALGALAAAGAPEPKYPQGPKTDGIDVKQAYVQTRWIALRSRALSDCPPIPGWELERSVDQVLARLKTQYQYQYRQPLTADDLALFDRLGLNRFCTYTTTDPNRKFPADRLPRGLTAAADRMALSGSANELEGRIWENLKDHFLLHSGRLPDLALTGEPNVRLTFVDSQPDGGFPPRPAEGSQHGYTLAHLAHQLICPGSAPCAVDVATRRALHHDKFEPSQPLEFLPDTAAGNIGTVDELADALLAEVLHWQQTGSKHLILNVSLGWDGELFSDLEERAVAKLEPSVQRVYKALQFAKAKGVLVIAAAGNRRGGPRNSAWPVLPAAWEMRRPSWWPLVHHHKVVYAVGGVDWQGLPLPNSRVGGRPRRVAYGDHAVADRGDHEPTGIYTGSSVSAAVVSSIAAAVWQLRPELRPAQVMQLIDRSGDPVPLAARADFYPWRRLWPLSFLIPAPRISQVSLCEAVSQACAASRTCRASAPQSCSLDRRPPLLGNSFPPSPDGLIFTETLLPPPMTTLCGPSTRFFRPDRSPTDFLTAPCPTNQFGGVRSQPWVLPQPDAVPCPGCVLGPPTAWTSSIGSPSTPDSSTLRLQISTDWETNGVHSSQVTLQENATLDIECYADGRLSSRTTYQINFEKEGMLSVPDIGRDTSLRGCTAQLNFVVVKNSDGTMMSIQNPVVVAPVAR